MRTAYETNAEHEERMRCMEHIGKAHRRQMVYRDTSKGMDWIEDEILAATIAANEWATAHGKQTITIDQARRADSSAAGHVDYAHKFALYLSELVYGWRK